MLELGPSVRAAQAAAVQEQLLGEVVRFVSKIDEFCIQNEEFCIQNDEFCRWRRYAGRNRRHLHCRYSSHARGCRHL